MQEEAKGDMGRLGRESFLSPLWQCVVKPALDAVTFSVCRAPLFSQLIHSCLSGRHLVTHHVIFGVREVTLR